MIHGSIWCKVSLIVQQKNPISTALDMVYFTALLSSGSNPAQGGSAFYFTKASKQEY